MEKKRLGNFYNVVLRNGQKKIISGFDVMVRKDPYRGFSGGDGYETISGGFDGGSSNGD